MSILRRPMFRKGGKVDSRGSGITSGLSEPRQNYKDGDIVTKYKEQLAKLRAERPALSLGDYLQIAATGAEIAGAPSQGGGISGALTTAAKPLANLGRGLATSMGAREKQAADLAGTLTGLEIERELGLAKVAKPYEIEVKANFIKEKYATKIANAKSQIEKDKLIAQRDKEISDAYGGLDLSDKYKILGNQKALEEAIGQATQYFEENPDQVKVYGKTKTEAIYNYAGQLLAGMESSFYGKVTGKADGGRVGYQEGGEVMDPMQQTAEQAQMPNEEGPIQLSYDELRARLPKQITDDIVQLLASSYEALADFAQIQTQADVNAFNTKYQVNLVLPQEA